MATRLGCSVTDCANNAQSCCCRPDIKVSGPCACGCDQTCCDSYEKKTESGANNAVGYQQPNPGVFVQCDAQNCVYNKEGGCNADSVRVDRCNSGTASTKSATECATFQRR